MAQDNATAVSKVYQASSSILEHMEKSSSARKPANEPLTEMPETCWLLSDREDIKRFHDYVNDPEDITPKGAKLLEMARQVSKERQLRKAKASANIK